MKKIIGIFAVLSFLVFGSFTKVLAQSFEGIVYWTMTMPQLDEDKHDMKINIKGGKSETEMDMGVQGGVKVIADRDAHKMWMVMEAMHMGYTMDMPSDTAAEKMMKEKMGNIEMKPTGQKATIAGHAAEEYLMKTKEGDISIWASGDFPKHIVESMSHNISSQPGQRGDDMKNAMKQLSAKGLMPVKIEMKQAGETAMSMEFVKYEEKKIDDSVFTPPSDIKFQPMPQMGGHGMN